MQNIDSPTLLLAKALSGRCDFCGAFSDSLDQLKSDSDSSVSIKICPACYSDYVRGGCDHPERDQ